MTILRGVDEAGETNFYDIPDAELSKYRVNSAPLTDEVKNRLFPGKDTLTKDDAQGVLPAGRVPGAEVEAYSSTCIYFIDDGNGNIIWWEDYC